MRKSVLIITATVICFSTMVGIATVMGIRLNISKSYPRGIYQLTKAPIAKGAMVIFCPNDNAAVQEARSRGYIMAGFCPGGTGTLIKKIFAAKNDKVEISSAGVFVNGTMLPNSQQRATDSAGRPLPKTVIKSQILDDHTVLLMSDYSQKSFDARYFGLTDKLQIISAIRPLWTW